MRAALGTVSSHLMEWWHGVNIRLGAAGREDCRGYAEPQVPRSKRLRQRNKIHLRHRGEEEGPRLRESRHLKDKKALRHIGK